MKRERAEQRRRAIVASGVVLLWAAFTLTPALPVAAADAVTDQNVAERAASAKTAADHEALAAYYKAAAAAAAAKVKSHEEMLEATQKAGRTAPSWKTHCRNWIAAYTKAENEAQSLAAEHERLAKEAGM